jgi:hypothetical protein
MSASNHSGNIAPAWAEAMLAVAGRSAARLQRQLAPLSNAHLPPPREMAALKSCDIHPGRRIDQRRRPALRRLTLRRFSSTPQVVGADFLLAGSAIDFAPPVEPTI